MSSDSPDSTRTSVDIAATFRLGLWIAAGIVSAGGLAWLSALIAWQAVGRALPFGQGLAVVLPYWLIWAGEALPITMIVARRGVGQAWPVRIGIHALVAIGAMLLNAAALAFVQQSFALTDWTGSVLALATGVFTARLPTNLFVCALIFAVVSRAHLHARFRASLVASQRLEAELLQARLDALRRQLSPHFLFNVLNDVAMLVRDGERAEALRAVIALGDLLRRLVDDTGSDLVSIRDELTFVERYLDLERLIHGSRLRVVIDAGADALDARVPFLLLQPLAENAVRHGVAQDPAAGCVRITVRRSGPWLTAEVSDDGPGLEVYGARSVPNGIGLRNTRQRLVQLFGDAHGLTLTRDHTSRTTVATIRIPYFVDTFAGTA